MGVHPGEVTSPRRHYKIGRPKMLTSAHPLLLTPSTVKFSERASQNIKMRGLSLSGERKNKIVSDFDGF